ncbi:hypothetical protein NOS3756_36560 [Nostoc sp. NIES-3756]|uniref:DM13 domain-containing protein n=1 Tax=Nostoc sp. NIES-3756 TaxID=1751286 RepID=UPI00071F2EB0|nr:DM13 domain-containing protein [Nostoc sp. NIES-3756]BAT54684.1 hypothetical protein NOS3756_36560 [Nostoc sp. NIES-3756]BAY37537.1 hypothetical protein NIES2111_18760 [Nostoc sp. NIES-2111]
MKYKHLIIIGCIAVLTIGCTNQNQTTTQTSTTTTVTSTDFKQGTFQSAAHPTKGQVTLVQEAGKNYLEFNQDFKTDLGPDLQVILTRSEKPTSGIKNGSYIRIARLQKISGSQRYALPDNVNLQEFKSVAIWCRLFNATFGYAVL